MENTSQNLTALNAEISVQKKRFYSLDVLKFLLAVVIVFHHFQQSTGAHFEHFNFFDGRIYFGYCVEFFFIISGFLAANSLKYKELPGFKKWIGSKFMRFFPIGTLSMLFMLAVHFVTLILRKRWDGGGLFKMFLSFTYTFDGGGIKFRPVLE